jgi:4-oxalomesaconate tautomerase
MQIPIPCVLMRGGTSRGPYFLSSDLPSDKATRDAVLLSIMGSPDVRQIDGLGGATPLTSKVAIISPSSHPWAQVDYLFAQVSIEESVVDTSPSCGNMLAGVGPFAIEQGLVTAEEGETSVRIRNVNTDSLIEAIVQTPNKAVSYNGTTRIDGVPGCSAAILLNFSRVVGSKTGKLLPTNEVQTRIDGIDVTCLDVAVPMVIARARDLAKTGYENPMALEADREFMERLERIRRQAGKLMGLGDVRGRVVPKVALLSEPRLTGQINSRYFTPDRCHEAHAVTGAICVATCTVLFGSVADRLVKTSDELPERVVIEHPSGTIEVALRLQRNDHHLEVLSAGVVRTARRIFSGNVYVPGGLWNGQI